MMLPGLTRCLLFATIVIISGAFPTSNSPDDQRLQEDNLALQSASTSCGRYGACDADKNQVCLNASTGLVCRKGCWEALLMCDSKSECTNYSDGYMCCRKPDVELPRALCYKNGDLVEHPPSFASTDATAAVPVAKTLHKRWGWEKKPQATVEDHCHGECEREGEQCCRTADTGRACTEGVWKAVLSCTGNTKCHIADDGTMCCNSPEQKFMAGLCYKSGEETLIPPLLGENDSPAKRSSTDRNREDGPLREISNGSFCAQDGVTKCGLYYGLNSIFYCNVDKWELANRCMSDGWQRECKDDPEPHCVQEDDPCVGCGDHFEACLEDNGCKHNETCHTNCNIDTCQFNNGLGMCGNECGWPCS